MSNSSDIATTSYADERRAERRKLNKPAYCHECKDRLCGEALAVNYIDIGRHLWFCWVCADTHYHSGIWKRFVRTAYGPWTVAPVEDRTRFDE